MICQGCGKPITGGADKYSAGEGDVYCGQCLIDRMEKYIKDTPPEKPKLKRLRETAAWKVAMIVILFLCLGVMAYQVPRIGTAFQGPKPVRMGTSATDAATDKCLNNLWRLGRDLQQGRKGLDQAVVCPVSGKPYAMVAGSNPEIHCPNPEAHGFRDLVISKRYPVPELREKR